MELPFNTVFSKEIAGDKAHGLQPVGVGVADWPTKRAWVQFAFDELAAAGYHTSSAYTMVKNKNHGRFVYRDSLWHGADMFGTGVASFGHVGGVHVQNVDTWEQYLALLEKGDLPLGRALPVTPHQLLIREMILQLKTGHLDPAYFRHKFGAAILDEFGDAFEELTASGDLTVDHGEVRMTRDGMLQVDRLLPAFFEPQYRGTRYT
jgi:oxygen-independent coproporphyrinogen-3 oxidase